MTSPEKLLPVFLCFLSLCSAKTVDFNTTIRIFPDNFFFGVSTSAYQIEGAWNKDGKSKNIWDHLTHKTPEVISDHSNADVACNSYELYERDIEMLKELGVDYYRFSISWSRLLPSGSADNVNPKGVEYYNKLIDKLLDNKILPFVTIYHWDLPQRLQDLGGWVNPLMAEYYQDYADVVFRLFGDRVSQWITFNEPRKFCLEGYGATAAAPALNASGIGEYMCGHTVLQAHARAYHLYNQKYREQQKGSVGISLDSYWIEPESNSQADEEAAERLTQFYLGWFAQPIFSKSGDYPSVMIDRIKKQSKRQGFSRSRLPKFTKEEVEAIKGSADFLGLNHYTSRMGRQSNRPEPDEPSFMDDADCETYVDESWPGPSKIKTVPWGFRKLLNWIKFQYDNPEVIVTENGYPSKRGLNDMDRVFYINQYLNGLLDAIEDDCRVSAYTVWSLMDNFEWMDGYTLRFGLYEVDISDRKKRRTPRESAKYYTNVIKTKSIKAYDACVDCFDGKSNSINYHTIVV